MLNNRRSEIEIIRDILILSQNGAKKTEIMYQVNLSYFQLNSYLSNLMKHNVIVEKPTPINGNGLGIVYLTTDKGKDLLTDISKTLRHFEEPFP